MAKNQEHQKSIEKSVEAIFKKAEAREEDGGLEKAIKIANDLNQDFGLGDPVFTKEGILQDNKSQCKSFLGRIEVEIDRHLDTLEDLKGVRLPFRSIKDREFRRVFDEPPCPMGTTKDESS